MLERQHCRRHEHGGLLAVDGSLEGGTDGNLGLAEAHVTADEAVHRLAALHIGFDGLGSGQLVGCVLIDERGLQLLLQVAVGRVGKALLLATCGIQADEFTGDVFQAALGAGFDFCPRVAAQAVQSGRLAVLAAVFREFVQRVDGDVCLVTVQVGEFDHLLRRAVHVDAQQASEFAHTQVFVDDIVAFLDLVEFLEREGEFARTCAVALEVVLVETVKYLVVGEDTQLQVVVNETLMQRPEYRLKGDIVATVLKDVVQAFNLLDTVAQDDKPVATGQEVGERLADEVEILVVNALWLAVQCQALHALFGSRFSGCEADASQLVQTVDKQVGIHHLVGGVGIAFVGDDGADRHALTGDFVDACCEPLLAAAQHDGVVADVVQQRHVVFSAIAVR